MCYDRSITHALESLEREREREVLQWGMCNINNL